MEILINNSTDNDKYLAQLSQALLSIAQISQLHIMKTRSAARLCLDSTAPKRKPVFSVGDWVVLENSTKEDKLSTKFRGPDKVTQVQDNNNYNCLNIVTNRQDVYHIGELHQFLRPRATGPTESAASLNASLKLFQLFIVSLGRFDPRILGLSSSDSIWT
jgi:hypothetical protein